MYIDILTKQDLLKRENDILQLFNDCFGKSISSSSWRWHYIDNPIGPSKVSLFYESGKLLGHYAVVPTRLVIHGTSFVAYRSMTTMVHPDARGKGLFLKLANRMYSLLNQCQASLVYGFPNKNVTDARKKYLDWIIPSPDFIIDIKGTDLISNKNLLDVLVRRSDIEWDLNDITQSNWRLSSPNTSFHIYDDLITKSYNGIENILHIGPRSLSNIKPDSTYRLMVPGDFNPQYYKNNCVFEYQFGYRIFDNNYLCKSFRPTLLMSDVF